MHCQGAIKRFRIALLALSSALACTDAWTQTLAPGDAARGLQKSAACVSCHEAHGRSTGTSLFPRIGGQNYEYLYYALREYRDGSRSRGWAPAMMSDAVRNFSDDDLSDVARYFSALPW